ncbi:MAG: GNAT family N-acetyltransferase [Dehalococcoidia bacterium]
MAHFEVRRVRAEEWPALREIRLQALLDTPTAFGSTHAVEVAFDDAVWIERAGGGASDEDRATFVVEQEGALVGLATGLAHDPVEDEGTLVGMFVVPELRGRGASDGLVRAVAAWARSLDLVRLRAWVTESNAPAIALYRRHGFDYDGALHPLDHTPTMMEQRMVLDLVEYRLDET